MTTIFLHTWGIKPEWVSQTYYFSHFPPKLHEIEKNNWTEGCACSEHPLWIQQQKIVSEVAEELEVSTDVWMSHLSKCFIMS